MELGDKQWDVLVFSETWRGERQETWIEDNGHTWFGSSGVKGQKGVGFLLHKRWKHTLFKPLSERVATLDVRIARKRRIRIVGVYMPHAAQPDEEVEAVYAMLEEENEEARKKGHNLLIAGDFNAEVGAQRESDDPQIIGASPIYI